MKRSASHPGPRAHAPRRTSIAPKEDTPTPLVVIDQSVVLALLNHGYCDRHFEVCGYLGGLVHPVKDQPVCVHVKHFYPSERCIADMLSNNVVEMPTSLSKAEKSFASYGFRLLGWYRSSLENSYTPTGFDLEKQFFLKSQFGDDIFGLIVALGTSKTNSLDAAYSLSLFRSRAMKDGYISVAVDFEILPQACTSSRIEREMQTTLLLELREASTAYRELSLDAQDRGDLRSPVDFQFDAYLNRLLTETILPRSCVLEADCKALVLLKSQLKQKLTTKLARLREEIRLDENLAPRANAVGIDRVLEAVVSIYLGNRAPEAMGAFPTDPRDNKAPRAPLGDLTLESLSTAASALLESNSISACTTNGVEDCTRPAFGAMPAAVNTVNM